MAGMQVKLLWTITDPSDEVFKKFIAESIDRNETFQSLCNVLRNDGFDVVVNVLAEDGEVNVTVSIDMHEVRAIPHFDAMTKAIAEYYKEYSIYCTEEHDLYVSDWHELDANVSKECQHNFRHREFKAGGEYLYDIQVCTKCNHPVAKKIEMI